MERNKGRILSGTAIKIIGIVLMTMDHLHQMFITQGAPLWLSWLGRPVSVLFIFLCAEGFYYTRRRKQYLLQLLVGSFFMSSMNRFLSSIMPMEEIALINNIFSTLFMAAFYMWMIEILREGYREKRVGAIILSVGGMILPFIVGLAMLLALSNSNQLAAMILLFIPNLISVEGGFVLVIMGILFYLLRKYRLVQIGVLLVISAFSWYSSRGSGNFQWLMAAAAVPLLLYNGQRGRGSKYFFYIFYPAHIYLFYVIAWFLRSH